MKFEDVPQSVIDLFDRVLKADFLELTDCKFKLVYRNKKQSSDGKYVIATIKKMNEFARFLSSAETNDEDGYDYSVIIDKNVFEKLDEKDKYRILRHELRHAVVDYEKADPFKLRGHTVETFYEDIDIEAKPGGDPRWMERVSVIAESVYSKEDDKVLTKE